MKINILQPKRALYIVLFILLSVVGMTKAMAQTPYRQYADNGVLLNFHEIDNVDFRIFLLYNLSQDDQFILVENEESGQFSVVTNDEIDIADFYGSFDTFYQNTYTDFQMLSKTDIDDHITVWKSQVAPQHFTSIMMDVTLRRSRSGENETCINATQVCTSDFYEYESATSTQTADDLEPYPIEDGCIGASYNPSWYYLRIADPGPLTIHMEGHDPNNPSTQRDIDFCLWGPFTEEQMNTGWACQHLTLDKIIDCNYSASYLENAFMGYPESEHQHNAGHGTVNYHVPQTGEYYLLMITNFSRQPCVITFNKPDETEPGTTDCTLLPPIVSNTGPYCVGETIHLTAFGVASASYSWTGPNNYRSRYPNPTRPNCTMAMAGPYICTITKNGQSASDTTWVEVYPNVNANFTATNVDVGHATQFNSTSTTNPSGYNISSYEWDFGDGQTATGATLSHTYVNAGTYPVTLTVSTGGYCTDEITQDVTVNVVPNAVINFADVNVKALCVANWDTNGDGELSYAEAMAVTSLGEVFKGKNITTFNELQYFTGLTSIGVNSFKSCSNLCSLIIPNSVTAIGNNAFFGCASLVSIVIPSSVASIGSEVFRDCPGLTQMKVNANNTVFDSRNNCNAIIETATNKLIYGCKNTVIPNSVTSIGGAFDGCSSLTSITIPNAVTSIGSYAFYGCISMTSMTVLAATPPSLGSSVFYNVNKSIPVYVESCDALAAYRNASGWNEFTNIQGGETLESEFTITTCNDYEWNGQVYTESGDYQQTFMTALCDSIVTLHLINNSEGEEYSVTECDSYTWRGMTYYYSGDYYNVIETPEGCQRFDLLHLTINNSETVEFSVTDCDYYTWHGTTYTQSGTYYYNTTTDYGCSRTEILHLTIETNHWTPVGDGQYPFSMTLYGVIQINGVEQYSDQLELGVFCGNECRGTAIANEFFLTHRYLVEANVYGDSGDQLTFKLYDHATHQELDMTPPGAITFTIDGYGNPVNPYVLNFISSVNITASVVPQDAGAITGTGEYIVGSTCTLTATANPGFQFQNWTLNGTVVSTSPTYTFTVTGAANYVAHFQYMQSRTLVSGWNWWSTYIEQEGTNGLAMLENSLGTSGIRIQGKNNSVDYFEYQGTGYWYGSLNTIANEQMYMIRTNAACDAVIVGDAAQSANHPITINGGWNWIGYPSSQSVDVNVAMSGFTPEANDVVKGRNSVSTYISYGGYQGWYGQLNTLEPGQGYMYRSYSNGSKTLTFQTGRGGETIANITPENNVFVPTSASNYADNMIVTAVIEMDGEELRSEGYEVAAFVGDECRGSVKLMYVEPFDRYVALLMAYGEGEEELRFVLTDGQGTSWSNDRVMYTANGMVGTMTEPAIIHFGSLGIEDNLQKPIHVYPNPSKGIFNIEGEGIRKIEVIDIYGQVILSKEVKNTNVQVDLSDKAAGAYLLRVVTDGGVVTHKLIKNN